MSALLIYMIKTAVYLAGFYSVFRIFLSRDTRFVRNRAFLILAVLVSFILPLISINIREQSSFYYFGKTLSEVIITGEGRKNVAHPAMGNNLNIFLLIFKIYLSGVIIFTLKLLTDIINLIYIIEKNKTNNERVIFCTGFHTSGFSAMGYIFLDRSLEREEIDEIIKHERNHIENNHFLDILLIRISIIFQWFNPFIYLIDRSLRAIHEFQADQGCLKSGIAIDSYQHLLLSNVFKTNKLNITNSFANPSLIKRRMLMMLRKPSSNFSSLKVMLAIPVVVASVFIISACEKNMNTPGTENEIPLPGPSSGTIIDIDQSPVYKKPKPVLKISPVLSPLAGKSEIKNNQAEASGSKNIQPITLATDGNVPTEVFVVVEEMPKFPGGDSTLMKFINENIKYPESAKSAGIEGRVILRFAVMANGKVANAQVLKGVNAELDNEALRVVNSMPEWMPGRQGGKPVNVWYSVPITFRLK